MNKAHKNPRLLPGIFLQTDHTLFGRLENADIIIILVGINMTFITNCL